MKCIDTPSPPVDSYPSYDDCLDDKRGDYQNCFVLYCVPQLYSVICSLIWAVLTGELGVLFVWRLTYLRSRRVALKVLWRWCTLTRPTCWIRPTSSMMVSAKPFPDSRGCCLSNLHKWGLALSDLLCVWLAANHESYGQRVSIHEVWRWTAIPTWSQWWYNPLAGVYRGYSTRQTKWKPGRPAFSTLRPVFDGITKNVSPNFHHFWPATLATSNLQTGRFSAILTASVNVR